MAISHILDLPHCSLQEHNIHEGWGYSAWGHHAALGQCRILWAEPEQMYVYRVAV